MTRRVPYVNFPAQYAEERHDILACVEEVFTRGDFIAGAAVEAFEKAAAEYIGVRHVVALNSGTDALILALRALGIGAGDEVVTSPNSFVATTGAIVAVGATPVFADVAEDQNIDPVAIERAITARTRAILPVHLTGRMADMRAIMAIAKSRDLRVIEDAAQSFGSKSGDRLAGTFGEVGCFSAHPLKNLNAAGDAGFLVTDDPDVAARVRRLRNHGLADRNTVETWGYVSRMDTLQAAWLLRRLDRVESVIERRRRNVAVYRSLLDPAHVFEPPCRPGDFNTFHTFVVQVPERERLRRHLSDSGVDTAVHYPVPLHLQPAAKGLGYKSGDFPVAERQADRILSLPVHQFLSDDDVSYVAETINRFYRRPKTVAARAQGT